MTVATGQGVHLSESLQSLVDSRLDTIDRMLLGRVARAERMAIVREVESQIHDLLGERETDELSREDVLAVLARLDPPEAFLPEELEGDVRTAVRPPARSARPEKHRMARASGILGLVALSSHLLLVMSYLLALGTGSEIPLLIGAGLSIPCMFVCSVLGIAAGVYSRTGGVWALVGIIASILALLFSLLIVIGFMLAM